MGKPFKKEIEESYLTIQWALEQNTDSINERIFQDTSKPLFIVGSGGALSACHFIACIYQNLGSMAKAITPLDLYYSRFALKDSKVLFISSSGRNNDILFAFKVAIQNQASEITTICMRKDAPLTKLSNSYSISKGIEFDIPTKKDGFLATNSLTAFFSILGKSSGYIDKNKFIEISPSFKNDVYNFVKCLKFDSTITVLYGGWSTPIAYDIESKFTEAALGSILLADYRNFGHGRHHWFAKRKNNSAIIALVTPEEKEIAEKTINLLPEYIPNLIIETEMSCVSASIELLLKAFELVYAVGKNFEIDPGRPGVPEFGSKLYHLKYSSFYKQKSTTKLSSIEEYAILKKINKSSLKFLQIKDLEFWREKYSKFVKKLESVKFSSIVFDYDGTLCNSNNRYNGYLTEEIIKELEKLLNAGIIVGIATGRGQSVRIDMQKSIINKSLWKNVIIGYYNGSEISTLDDNNCPNTNANINETLSMIEIKIQEIKKYWSDFEIRLRPNQLTIESTNHSNWNNIKKNIQNIVMLSLSNDLQLLESSHSLDIVVRGISSKLNVVNKCNNIAKENSKSENCLTIGDKGQWPGNDYELLSTPFSLSVDEVSFDPDSCWNLSSIGKKNSEATLEYLMRLRIKNGNLIFI